jgi:lipoprotein-releasing system permease protein
MVELLKSFGGSSNWMMGEDVFSSIFSGSVLLWGKCYRFWVIVYSKYFKLFPLNPDTYYVGGSVYIRLYSFY